jgi:4-amino-4-deoxy-L-arabinose transferase-like glycosyltransferase
MNRLPWNRPAGWLWLVVALYLVLAVAYAVYTPAWQAPDEPAHYNYIRYLAEEHRFPVLKPGDFPAAYLEEIKGAGFPPEMSIAPIRYEFHQPPLYYLLAMPVYRLFGGALLPLRLLSVVLGALLLPVIYWTVREVVPEAPGLALGTAAFVAFLPMHLAMTAAVNNDSLAELLGAVVLLLTLRYLKPAASWEGEARDVRLPVLLAIATGLALLVKSSLYILLPVVVLAIAVRHLWLAEEARLLRASSLYLLPAVLLALPWWLRNAAVYGGLDLLGLGRHDAVVVGQLRTAEFVASQGPAALVQDLTLTTFRSFWGQFGWMGVLLDQRLYQAVAVLSLLAVAGLLAWAAGAWRRRAGVPRWQWAAVAVLALWAGLTLASYLWYNISFVQHQGRYLFRALLPIGLAVALGWREALERERALGLAAVLAAGAGLARLLGWLPNWPLLMVVAMAAALAVRRFLPPRWDPLVQACPYLLLVPLDLASLFLFVVPQLA